MWTKPQTYLHLMRRARDLESEATSVRAHAKALRAEMGHPDEEQIERAVEMGKDIVRGCTQDL